MKTKPCLNCEREMIPARLWAAADKGDRSQWAREGKCQSAGKVCKRCQQAAAKARRPPKPPAPIVTPTCADCSNPAWSPRATYCEECRARRNREWRENERQIRAAEREHARAERAKESHRESPAVLTEDEGRWVTGRGASGLPIQVWEAA